jgi:hypothetical protein
VFDTWRQTGDTRRYGGQAGTVLLWLALIVALACVFQAVAIAERVPDITRHFPENLKTVPLMSTDAAIALTVGLAALLGARSQFHAGIRPILNGSRDDEAGPPPKVRAELENAGLGPAVLGKVLYSYKLNGTIKEFTEGRKMRECLARDLGVGLVDIEITGLYKGYTMPRGSTQIISRLPGDLGGAVTDPALDIRFRSVIGGRYRQHLDLLPPP